jgi:fused signal recognition particle receptor
MSTEWRDILDLGERTPPPAAEPEAEREEERRGVFRRLRESLSKSRQALSEELTASLFDRIDEETWERLEEALILADVGAPTTAKIVERLESETVSGQLADADAVRERLIEIVAEIASAGESKIDLSAQPAVLMLVGVNGTGKTTTIGKVAWHLSREFGLSVIVAAADTFRAAAVEQLSEWAERSGAEIVRSAPGADPGAVAYDAVEAAVARGTGTPRAT